MASNESVGAPLVVQSADNVVWDESADIVVIGFGGAGAVAAIQARECGASVIVIDRFEGGGATAYSGGIIYAGATRFQREGGYNDTVEEMYKYLDAEETAVAPKTLRRFCETSSADMEWLSGLGVPFGNTVFEGKAAFPPDDHWIYYSGREKVPFYAEKAKPAPRGHRPTVNGMGGNFYYQKLREASLKKNIQLLEHSPVTRLIVDKNNRVIGVEINALDKSLWEKHMSLYRRVHPWMPFNSDRGEKAIVAAMELEKSTYRPKLIRAQRGVILATGGFNHNFKMLCKHRPELSSIYKNLLRLGSMGDSGIGIKLGESAGGVTALMEKISVGRNVAPPHCYANGILVNQEGKRFVNEGVHSLAVGSEILKQPHSKAWLILEAKDFWVGIKDCLFSGKNFLFFGAPVLLNIMLGGTRKGRTIEELGKKIGSDSFALTKTVAEFNAMATSDRKDPLGKLDELIQPVSKGPFYAINMSLDNKFAPAIMITLGGLSCDEDTGMVKRMDGSLIEGLYAAGLVAMGIHTTDGYMSGLSIADTVFTGRRAARSAAGVT